MSNLRFIQYINLPPIPTELIDHLPKDDSQWRKKDIKGNMPWYRWSDEYNREINAWCQRYISSDMYWAFQLMSADMPKHLDRGTTTKFNYVINTGGDDVWTRFWTNDQESMLAEYQIEPFRWHIFKSDTYHSVEGVQPGQVRIAVTGRIFADYESEYL